MTNEEINVAIARACGLHPINTPHFGTAGELHDSWSLGYEGDTAIPIPLYATDLNAMYEAVSILDVGFDGSQADGYQHALWEIVNPGRGEMSEHTLMDVAYLQAFVEATARQRSEAFLRTLDLWVG